MFHECRHLVSLHADRRVCTGSYLTLRPSKTILSCKKGHIEKGEVKQTTTFSFTMKGNADSFLFPSF